MKISQIIFVSSILFHRTGWSQEVPKGPIDYSKLELNKQALLGSRWSIDRHQNITVFHAFQIVDLVKIDTNDMSIRIDFFMKQRWVAGGLDLPEGLFKPDDSPDTFISVDEDVLKSVWSPDSFIPNARETKILSINVPQSSVNIFKNKTIIYKARMYAVLGCSFYFQWYPLDIQVCDLVFESYKYHSADVRYEWEPKNPVSALEGIILYQYDFFLPPKLSKGTHKRFSGKLEYPNVIMTFKFERKLGNNVIQIFTPTILVVILSFFSFWLGLDAVPGRISLLVTCILTLVTMHSGLKGVIPPVHYIKMMDIWMIGCMTFVFGAICEFIVVKYLKWRAIQAKNEKEEREKYLEKNGLARVPHSNALSKPPIVNYKNMTLPNALYPEFGQIQPYIQNDKHFSENRVITNSAQKRQAWQNAQAHALGMHPEYMNHPHNRVPDGYPAELLNMNMHAMSLYNQNLMPEPPSNSRPIWVKIDRVCRVVFFLLFAIFNAAFWPVLLLGSAKQHVNV